MLGEDACNTVIKRAISLPLVRSYSVCESHDYLYCQGTNLTECPKCQVARPVAGTHQVVKIMSIADKIAELLASEEFREGVQAYADFRTANQQDSQQPKVFRDVFDGEIYENLTENGVIDSNPSIIIKLDVDGFTCSSSRSSMTMVNAVILSLDPSERYTLNIRSKLLARI